MAVIVYKAKICLECGSAEEIHLISLSNEPGFGYVTSTGYILVKARSMADASAMLLDQYKELTEVDSRPYWQNSA